MELKREITILKGKNYNVYSTNVQEILELELNDSTNNNIINNVISTHCFMLLESFGTKTHFISVGTNDISKFVEKLNMIPLEIICRRYTSGDFCDRFNVEEGIEISHCGIEFKYNMIGKTEYIPEFAIKFLNIASREECLLIRGITRGAALVLSKYFSNVGIELIDFKLEFGRNREGDIIVASDISPITCTLIDKETGKKVNLNEKSYDFELSYQSIIDEINEI